MTTPIIEPCWEEIERISLRREILDWFDEHQRSLPWREDVTPYETWISEIMLQQTQVATVVDYYNRWMERFPTVIELAEAEIDDVLKLWAGLGYYRRARFLHAAALQIQAEGMPQTAADWLKMPGVGRYTAGAIGSIALGEVVSVVDGNVKRVFARLLAWDEDPSSSNSEKMFWRAADELVDPDRPGDFNQGLMELGALVCRPKNPLCEECPVWERCEGFASGAATDFPAPKVRKTKQRDEERHVALVVRGGRVWTVRTPADELLGGLWGFPQASSLEMLSEALLDPPDSPATIEKVGEVRHIFSHIRMTYIVYVFEGLSPWLADDDSRWLEKGELETLGMSRAMVKVADLLR